jgi:hypothetical protein
LIKETRKKKRKGGRPRTKPMGPVSEYAKKASDLSDWGKIMSPLGRPVARKVIALLEFSGQMSLGDIVDQIKGSGAKRRIQDVLNTLRKSGVVFGINDTFILNRAWLDQEHSKLI